MLLLRLSPLVPFNVFNYVCGLTSVSLRDFVLGGVGMLPGTVVYVYLGASLASIGAQLSRPHSTLQILLLIIGTLFAIAGLIFISHKVKKILDTIISKKEEVEVAQL